MQIDLIRRLNELNRQFYQRQAKSFSQSRSYYWQGWNKLVPYLQELADHNQGQLRVLDLGCGNGRFGTFIAGQLEEIKLNYFGVDNSKELLNIAKTHEVMDYIQANFIELDIVESLLDGTFTAKIKAFSPDFISALGVLHHIPSKNLRLELIKQLGQILSQPGYLTFTTWNFLESEKLKQKIIDPQQFDLSQDDLEKNDVILDWQRGSTDYRYCHYTDPDELDELVKNSGLTEESRFKADGKNGNLNSYVVLRKNEK